MLVLWLQLSLVLGHRHILKRSMLSTPSRSSPHKLRSPMYPERRKTYRHLQKINFFNRLVLITESPPDAKEILGISCFAISSLVSSVTSDKNLLETVSVAFEPALYISGVSQMHWITCLSIRRFLHVFKPAVSHTRLMHSLQTIIFNH